MNTRSYRKNFRTSAAFPIEVGERLTIRDGRGRTSEIWKIIDVLVGKTHRFVSADVTVIREVA